MTESRAKQAIKKEIEAEIAAQINDEIDAVADIAPVVEPFDFDDPALYLNRELTWLAFNRRVLHEADDDRTPLLERVKVPVNKDVSKRLIAANGDHTFVTLDDLIVNNLGSSTSTTAARSTTSGPPT